MPEPKHEHIYGVNKWQDFSRRVFDYMYFYPVEWFHDNVVERLRGPSYPYYHRKFNPVKTIDECEIDDKVCFYEANQAYERDKRIDTIIIDILFTRAARCSIYEGKLDADTTCRKELDDLFQARCNYYQKYGEMGVPHSVIDAYMKQKHHMVYMRRHPDYDFSGVDDQRKFEAERRANMKKIRQPLH
ncbi:unnamed protein product [Didymodactylos carnosus]|uniref:NADH dehydrogenase [ubiquinone] 1 beta subcomplex subunit 10 n=1 Tax=Didymodactylos carnosus TaxID=1234261 RepID=A0A814FP97_9BILA|nr:unnamed protein product [Didymodactylos carnosus]CAF0985648.1 unnamed protein product [Didymodactylos carnosus]CAF3607082.1 unnamed protein product [Didymodactylos carnosus]CAF3757943.1 unnamed protein product [Didymodactylos carnosus]